jgi:hypothetical protein
VAALFALAEQLELRLAQVRGQVDKITPSLLARVFASQLVPQNPADEPVKNYLEREKATETKATNERNKMYRILSFDGGGIRGLVTLALLKRLEMQIPNLINVADLLAGTSTGAIIALGRACAWRIVIQAAMGQFKNPVAMASPMVNLKSGHQWWWAACFFSRRVAG